MLFRSRQRVVAIALAVWMVGCIAEPDKPEPRVAEVYPRLLYRPEHRDLVFERFNRELYAAMLAELKRKAHAASRAPEKVWDVGAWSIDGHIAQANTAAPAVAAARLAAWSCGEPLLSTVQTTRAYLETALTSEAGGIGRLGVPQVELPELWNDSLFNGSFLMAWGGLFGEVSNWDLYAGQIIIGADELQDKSGLFLHGLMHEKPFPALAVFWGRGNGWVASILSRFLTVLPKYHPRYAAVAEVERKLLERVLTPQAQNSGMRWMVVNHLGEGYVETAATALLGDALHRGAKLSLMSAGAAAGVAAPDSARSQVIAIDGIAAVRGASEPTQPGGLEYYAGSPVGGDIHAGIGAVRLLLTSR